MGRKRKAGALEDDSALMGGSSASASSAPASKRARKVAQRAIPEKRAARIRTTCPKNIQERVARVMSQRYGCSPIRRNFVHLD